MIETKVDIWRRQQEERREELEEPHEYHYAESLAEYLLYGQLPYANGGTNWEMNERKKRGLVLRRWEMYFGWND